MKPVENPLLKNLDFVFNFEQNILISHYVIML